MIEKGDDDMDILSRLNGVVEYLENNLLNEENISAYAIAKIACLAPQQFFRVFPYIAGVSVYEYVRRRKLTLAAQELLSTDIKIIDLALKYGYESPDSFARAFQAIHGLPPSAARKAGATLIAFPRLRFHISIKGDAFVNYKIEQKDGFTVMGKKLTVSVKGGENMKSIPAFWDQSMKDGCFNTLCSLCRTPLGVMGVCANMVNDTFDYFIAIEKPSDMPMADGFETLEVPASTWVCFEAVGPMPNAIQDVWKYATTEWLPSSGYQHAGTPDIEVYSDGDTQSKDYLSYVWIPIVRENS